MRNGGIHINARMQTAADGSRYINNAFTKVFRFSSEKDGKKNEKFSNKMILNAKYRVIRKEKQNLISEPMVNKFDILCGNNLNESEKQ